MCDLRRSAQMGSSLPCLQRMGSCACMKQTQTHKGWPQPSIHRSLPTNNKTPSLMTGDSTRNTLAVLPGSLTHKKRFVSSLFLLNEVINPLPLFSCIVSLSPAHRFSSSVAPCSPYILQKRKRIKKKADPQILLGYSDGSVGMISVNSGVVAPWTGDEARAKHAGSITAMTWHTAASAVFTMDNRGCLHKWSQGTHTHTHTHTESCLPGSQCSIDSHSENFVPVFESTSQMASRAVFWHNN